MAHSDQSRLSHSTSIVLGIAASVTCQSLLFHVPEAIAQSNPTPANPAYPPYKTIAPDSPPSASSNPKSTIQPSTDSNISLSFSLDNPPSLPPLPADSTSTTKRQPPSIHQTTSTKEFNPPSSPPPSPSATIAKAPTASTPQGSSTSSAKSPAVSPPAATSLSFDIPDRPAPTPKLKATDPSSSTLPPALAQLFVGNSNSLAAIAIGSAEGTRTPEGGKTWAFKGHTDPGNGVWNLGTFSWQHGASSPEEADKKQLARLQKQALVLNRQAIALEVPWGLEEQLNALDLANQSPMAALNRGGYLERLKQAYDQEGLTGTEAILWARTWSYRHPSGTRWNAPGLGNTHHGIRTDQKRRMDEIAEAIAAQTAPKVIPKENSVLIPKSTPTPTKGIDILFDLFQGQEVIS